MLLSCEPYLFIADKGWTNLESGDHLVARVELGHIHSQSNDIALDGTRKVELEALRFQDNLKAYIETGPAIWGESQLHRIASASVQPTASSQHETIEVTCSFKCCSQSTVGVGSAPPKVILIILGTINKAVVTMCLVNFVIITDCNY